VLNTRWSCGVQTQAKGKYSKMITLGQQLNLPKFQCYLDYMGAKKVFCAAIATTLLDEKHKE
jgi:hypothetical protein